MNPILTIEGRLGADPELRFTTTGMAVCSFSLVTSDRKKNDSTNEWTDVNPTWFRCSAFKTLAENVAESLHKGDLVIVVGKLSQRDYETKEGEKRTAYQEIAVNAMGPSLQFVSVGLNRPQRGSTGGSGASAPAGAADPWATPPATGTDEPPF